MVRSWPDINSVESGRIAAESRQNRGQNHHLRAIFPDRRRPLAPPPLQCHPKESLDRIASESAQHGDRQAPGRRAGPGDGRDRLRRCPARRAGARSFKSFKFYVGWRGGHTIEPDDDAEADAVHAEPLRERRHLHRARLVLHVHMSAGLLGRTVRDAYYLYAEPMQERRDLHRAKHKRVHVYVPTRLHRPDLHNANPDNASTNNGKADNSEADEGRPHDRSANDGEADDRNTNDG